MKTHARLALLATTLVIIVMALGVCFATGCNKPAPAGGTTAAPAGAQTAAAVIYTCPMHPEVQSKTPGKCPKCGMDLVKKG